MISIAILERDHSLARTFPGFFAFKFTDVVCIVRLAHARNDSFATTLDSRKVHARVVLRAVSLLAFDFLKNQPRET